MGQKQTRLTERPERLRCRDCGIEKPFIEGVFVKTKNCRFGLAHTCLECRAAFHRVWKAANREAISARRKTLYRQSPKERTTTARREARQWAADPYKMRAKILYEGIRERSRRLNLPWDRRILTRAFVEDWLRKQPFCACCSRDFQLQPRDGIKSDASPSIDRIEPARGYVLGNVALLCWRCNNLKRDATVAELETVVLWLKSQS